MRTLAPPVGFAVALLTFRMAATQTTDFAFLAWNLALALVPVALSAPARGGLPRLLAWWLFFPNAAYLVTDLVHLRPRQMPYWFDIGMMAAFAWAGLVAASWSLERMASRVERARPRALFVFAVGASGGFAIWVGRFLRLNSWDALVQPQTTLEVIARAVTARPTQAVGVTVLFGGMMLVVHATMTRQRSGDEVDGAQRRRGGDGRVPSWRLTRARR